VISITRIADIPIYIADSASRFNGEPPLVGGNVRLAVPSKVDPHLVKVGLGLGRFFEVATRLWV
jgi:hypothetical protein